MDQSSDWTTGQLESYLTARRSYVETMHLSSEPLWTLSRLVEECRSLGLTLGLDLSRYLRSSAPKPSPRSKPMTQSTDGKPNDWPKQELKVAFMTELTVSESLVASEIASAMRSLMQSIYSNAPAPFNFFLAISRKGSSGTLFTISTPGASPPRMRRRRRKSSKSSTSGT